MKVNKKQLVEFISRTYLSGLNDKFNIEFKDSETIIETKTSSGQLLTNSKAPKLLDFVGVVSLHDVERFLKYINLIEGDSIDLDFKSNNESIVYKIILQNNNSNINYFAGNPSVIPQAPKLKNLPDFNYFIDIDESLSDYIIKCVTVLDSGIIHFNSVKNKLYLIIGDIDNKNDSVNIDLKSDSLKDTPDSIISFEKQSFVDILKTSKKLSCAIDFNGLVYCEYKGDIEVSYYLKPLQKVK